MKKNLFRGKGKKDGEWKYGSLVLVLEGSFIWDQRMHKTLEKDLTFAGLDDMIQAVIPESVGQFTGRCIKSGTKLFEGDIVKRTCTEKIEALTGNEIPCDAWEIGVVRYNNDFAGFEISIFKQKDLWYGKMPHGNTLNHYNWEIIGNTTDNPDILENDDYN